MLSLLFLLSLVLALQSFGGTGATCNTNCCGQSTECCFEIQEGDELGRFVGNASELPAFAQELNNTIAVSTAMFSFVSGTTNMPLVINATTGEIRTNAPLDREILEEIFKCFPQTINLVTNSPTAFPATFYVKVLDLNDNPPTFQNSDQDFVNLSATESDSENSEFVCSNQLVAVDIDAPGPNSNITYSILGNSNFTVHPEDAALCVASLVPVDREQTETLILTLQASDKGSPQLTTNITLNIAINDINDNSPIFNVTSPYHFEVPEDTKVGSIFTIFTATDKDSENFGPITYQLISQKNSQQQTVELFTINSSTGALTLSESLDFESSENLFELTVKAADGGNPQMSSTLDVNVNVTNVNDNAPVIKGMPEISIIQIQENNRNLPSIIFTITDADKVDMVEAQVVNGKEYFEINFLVNDFWQLNLTNPIDREDIDQINLSIEVTDTGSPPLKATKNLTVDILDVNDNAPTLTKTNFSISECLNSDRRNIDIKEYFEDPDEGLNGTFDEIVGISNDMNQINIQPIGIFRVENIDREKIPGGVLPVNITLFDDGTPQLSSTITMFFTVTDCNDNRPEFNQTVYNFSILENVNFTRIGQVLATDLDSGENGTVIYNLTGQFSSFFTINDEGIIYNLKPFDREKLQEYKLIVVAMDEGSPPLTANNTIFITINDVNDEPPHFTEDGENVTFLVPPGAEIGTMVGTVNVQDGDEMSVLNFSISDGHFRINETGVIFIKQTLTEPKYVVEVSVTDGKYNDNITVIIQKEIFNPDVVIGVSSLSVVIALLIVFIFIVCLAWCMRRHNRKSLALPPAPPPTKSSFRSAPSSKEKEANNDLTQNSIGKSQSVNFRGSVEVKFYNSEQAPAKKEHETTMFLHNDNDTEESESRSDIPGKDPNSTAIVQIADDSETSSIGSEVHFQTPHTSPLRTDALRKHDIMHSHGSVLGMSHYVQRPMMVEHHVRSADDIQDFPDAFPPHLQHYMAPTGHSDPSITLSHVVSASPGSEDSSPPMQYIPPAKNAADSIYYRESKLSRSPQYDDSVHLQHHMYKTSPHHPNGMGNHYSSSSSSSQQTATEMLHMHPIHYPMRQHIPSRDLPMYHHPTNGRIYHSKTSMDAYPPPLPLLRHSPHPPPPPPPPPPSSTHHDHLPPRQSMLPMAPETRYSSFSEENSTVSAELDKMLEYNPRLSIPYDYLSLTDDVRPGSMDMGRQ